MFSARPGPKDKSRFPPTHVMHQLWEAFVENFDPLTKIVHVPSLRPVVERAIGDVTNIPRNLEALISAILGAGILSLKDRDCQQRFGETRRSMLSKYSSATEAALSRAKFMATTSLVVLQALVIHLYSVRDVYEPRTVWTLTGVAVRIAQGLSLDRDGTTLGLSPFDTEIRRRIWWQLKSHDFRTAELCGLAKFRDIETSPESTKWPSNIGGNDLHPKMSSLEITSTGLTDAAFVAFKFEMTKFAAGRISIFRKRGIDSSQWNLDIPGNDKEEIQTSAETLREALEMKYLRYCDPSQPLHLVLLLVGRYGMNIVTFLTHHPRRWAKMEHVTPTERVLVWDGSIKLLDQYSMMQSNPIIQQFAWHARLLYPMARIYPCPGHSSRRATAIRRFESMATCREYLRKYSRTRIGSEEAYTCSYRQSLSESVPRSRNCIAEQQNVFSAYTDIHSKLTPPSRECNREEKSPRSKDATIIRGQFCFTT
ncbi:hypothetical protein JI435_063030 [Parastagonospora nodorum SN15]|uniref:Xylanolytic transcriptional activator regulatory domain-containing protein n=2 Tax=Phaeosphaeria nodorum (strain SN15 / ATCC MYA-4574 / FGSC 10173) TaxID=321614 RepID=A0A7U2F576_PHANO|nr:hypothetical protein JI435_063030 [Parastagonospora nodorum SN15]